MIVKLAAWNLALFSLAPSAAWAQSANSPPAEMCRVLEAAYTAAIHSKVVAYPIDIGPNHQGDRAKLLLSGAGPQALKAGELDDLVSRAGKYWDRDFQPRCQSKAKPIAAMVEGHPMTVSFTNPIFSTDGRLAVVLVSFATQPLGFGYGELCVARAIRKGWTARCEENWIS